MLEFKTFFKKCAKVKRTVNYCCVRFLSRGKTPSGYYYDCTKNVKNADLISENVLNDKGMNIRYMNASVLCIFSNMLLRENIRDERVWKCIEKRSYELLDRFEINEVASFLFCFSKIRFETQLYDSFISIIKRKYEYLNTTNLAMLISAYAKRKEKDLVMLLKEEFKKKIYTVHNIVEISMILNALVKCNIYDEELLNKLSSIVTDIIIHTNNIQVRDLCVVVFCYSYILYNNKALFKILAQKIIPSINDVKLVDLCRIFFSYMNLHMNSCHILRVSAGRLKSVLDRSSIDEVISCIHFLPNLKKTTEKIDETSVFTKWKLVEEKEFGYSVNYVSLYNYIVNMFNEKLTSSINILDSNQISSVFYFYSKHNILMNSLKLEMFIKKIGKLHLSVELKIYILYSLTIFLKNLEDNVLYNFDITDVNKIFPKTDDRYVVKNTEPSNESNASVISEQFVLNVKSELAKCLQNWEKEIHLFINNYKLCTVQDIIKILHFFYILENRSDVFIQSIKHYVIFNYRSINEFTAKTLLFYFQKFFRLAENDDFVEILKHKLIKGK